MRTFADGLRSRLDDDGVLECACRFDCASPDSTDGVVFSGTVSVESAVQPAVLEGLAAINRVKKTYDAEGHNRAIANDSCE
jgi:hypothetical protein